MVDEIVCWPLLKYDMWKDDEEMRRNGNTEAYPILGSCATIKEEGRDRKIDWRKHKNTKTEIGRRAGNKELYMMPTCLSPLEPNAHSNDSCQPVVSQPRRTDLLRLFLGLNTPMSEPSGITTVGWTGIPHALSGFVCVTNMRVMDKHTRLTNMLSMFECIDMTEWKWRWVADQALPQIRTGDDPLPWDTLMAVCAV